MRFLFLILLTLLVVLTDAVLANLQAPEFTEPIKNITVSEGSNIELSCYVKHLGSYRVIWLKKEGEKEHFVAINSLKITKNPRITVTVLQTSDDVTQSNVYIRNTEEGDTGKFECAINTNPMISQTGDLEVTKPTISKANEVTEEDIQKDVESTTQSLPTFLMSKDQENEDFTDEEVDTSADLGKKGLDKSSSTAASTNATTFLDKNTTTNGNLTLCSDMKSVWEEATDSIKEFLKNFVNSLVNFTCSFLTLNS